MESRKQHKRNTIRSLGRDLHLRSLNTRQVEVDHRHSIRQEDSQSGTVADLRMRTVEKHIPVQSNQ